jgi:hypothetical protein
MRSAPAAISELLCDMTPRHIALRWVPWRHAGTINDGRGTSRFPRPVHNEAAAGGRRVGALMPGLDIGYKGTGHGCLHTVAEGDMRWRGAMSIV